MPDKVNVPMVGSVGKKWVWIGGGAVLLIVGVAYYRHKSAASAAASAPATATGPTSVTGYTGAADPYPADGTQGNPNDPNSMDPATGQTYGDEQSGAGGIGGMYGSTSPNQYDPYAASNYGGYYQGNYMQTNPTISQITTNEEWLTQAENDLQGVGYDQATAAAALSKVLAGLSVTESQAQIFQQALGIDGNPPQGYPHPIKISQSAATYTVPNVTGLDLKTAAANIAAAHLHPHGPKIVAGETQTVTAQSPGPGAKLNAGATVNLTVKVSQPAAHQGTVPNVVGAPLSSAVEAIQDAGFHPHGPAVNPKIRQVVKGQSPHAGAHANSGSTVTLAVR